MAFEDLRDQIGERAQAAWARLQENSTYIQLSERYQSLSPNAQKGVLAGAAALIGLILFMIPYSWYGSSSDKVAEFELNKETILEMFEARRDSGELATAPPKIDQNELIGRIQNQMATLPVSPEQVKSVQPFNNKQAGKPTPGIPPEINQLGASVILSKLNLNQLVKIGYHLQTIVPGVKMVGMDIQAAADDPRYFDVTYNLVGFSIPDPPAKPAKGGKRSRAKAEDEG